MGVRFLQRGILTIMGKENELIQNDSDKEDVDISRL